MTGEVLRGYEALELDRTAGRVSPVCASGREPPRIQPARDRAGRAVRNPIRRCFGLRGPARGPHRFRVDPHRRFVHQHPARLRPFHNSREQHRADDRFGGRIRGRGRDLYDARAHFPRLLAQHGILAHFFPGAARRNARRAVHDSVAAAADRQGTRQSDVSRGHGVRRCAGCRRARRIVCRARFLGAGPRRRVHVLHEYAGAMARPAGLPAEMAAWRVHALHDHIRISRRGLHHRAARGGNAFCGRRDFLAGDDAGDPVLWLARAGRAALSEHDSNSADESRPALGDVHSPDGRGSGRGIRTDYADKNNADDLRGADGGAEGRARAARGDARGEPHRARPFDASRDRRFDRDHGHGLGAAEIQADSRRAERGVCGS